MLKIVYKYRSKDDFNLYMRSYHRMRTAIKNGQAYKAGRAFWVANSFFIEYPDYKELFTIAEENDLMFEIPSSKSRELLQFMFDFFARQVDSGIKLAFESRDLKKIDEIEAFLDD